MKKSTIVAIVALILIVVAFVVDDINTKKQNEPDMGGDTATVETLKFGLGLSVSQANPTSADGETNGNGKFTTTAVAVLVDKDNKIVQIALDTADVGVEFTSDGKAVPVENPQTKYELGNNYGMSLYGQDLNGDGKVLEWYAQADAFMNGVKGKTLDEVKAMVNESWYATGEIATAGCTINVYDFVQALDKAMANTTDSSATANDVLGIGFAISVTTADASDADGKIAIDVSVAAGVKNAEDKLVVAISDVVQGEYTFNAKGEATNEANQEIKTKREKGADYGMSLYGQDLNGDGKVLEWFEQADAFDKACVGKTANEISALVVNGYQGTEDVQNAGCTIAVGDIAKAIVKSIA